MNMCEVARKKISLHSQVSQSPQHPNAWEMESINVHMYLFINIKDVCCITKLSSVYSFMEVLRI